MERNSPFATNAASTYMKVDETRISRNLKELFTFKPKAAQEVERTGNTTGRKGHQHGGDRNVPSIDYAEWHLEDSQFREDDAELEVNSRTEWSEPVESSQGAYENAMDSTPSRSSLLSADVHPSPVPASLPSSPFGLPLREPKYVLGIISGNPTCSASPQSVRPSTMGSPSPSVRYDPAIYGFSHGAKDATTPLGPSCGQRGVHPREDIQDCKVGAWVDAAITEQAEPRPSRELRIDPILLADHDAILGDALWEGSPHPHITELFANGCYELIKSSLGTEITLHPQQVHVVVRIAYMPNISECNLGLAREAFEYTRNAGDSRMFGGLITLRGVVSCLYSQTYACNGKACRNPNTLHFLHASGGNRMLKRNSEGICLQTSTNVELHDVDLICSHCGQLMPELVADRVSTVQQNGLLTSLSTEGCQSNLVSFQLDNDLVNTVEVGDYLELLGKPVDLMCHQSGARIYPKYAVAIAVNNARKLPSVPPYGPMKHRDLIYSGLALAWISFLLQLSIYNVEISRRSPLRRGLWIIFAVSWVDKIAPGQLWRKAKLSMLLSLVSVPADVEESTMPPGSEAESPRKAVNLLFVTDCYVPALSRLVSTAAGYRRSAKWYHGTERKHSTLLNILRDEGKSVEQCIQASVVTQAKDGILIVGLDKLRKTQIKDLTDVLQMPPHNALISGDQSLSLQHNFALWGEVSSNGAKMDKKAKASDTFSLEVIVIEDIDVLLSTHILNEELTSEGTPAEDRRDLQRISPKDFEQVITGVPNTLAALFFCIAPAMRKISKRNGFYVYHFGGTIPFTRIRRRRAKFSLKFVFHRRWSGSRVATPSCVCATQPWWMMRHSILLVEESMALASGVSILGFTSLPQDQENLHFLFGPQRNLRSTVPDDDQMDLDSDDDDEGDTEAEKAFNRQVTQQCLSTFRKTLTLATTR
ncbi:hypothetical protein BC832DRAFT_614560 [Gaertneriomyces semiglobifer]|nr:hypothetical protein BC832DRAFT_614560 [Gaertneriomyces semiglobifer]